MGGRNRSKFEGNRVMGGRNRSKFEGNRVIINRNSGIGRGQGEAWKKRSNKRELSCSLQKKLGVGH